eukprot:CAMPEP_0171348544 /NCGR_PEP_ID=MMETSP0878-20121228/31168_1 /TAXON_ID=67004 /ORGANISM="Thalassiosira weissflogii, Strain CCMP1336" /LENGTH=413 /DNA_ID=CAMNT_0011852923 /DNA_START=29 /DNA_END=1270 /DNA_ORIENTATION=+
MTSNLEVITIPYADLLSACQDDTSDASNFDTLIEASFGSLPTSLGIIAVTDVPALPELRLKLLPLARKLANLPQDQLDEITDANAQYQVGWSHGREKLEGDKLDLGKGSFYFNPLTDNLVESMLERRQKKNNDETDNNTTSVLKWDESIDSIKSEEELKKLAQSQPGFFAPNVWPTKTIPELETVAKEVGILIHQVGILIAKCCDSYVSAKCPRYDNHKLENVLRHSKCCKARLLHYFASETPKVNDETGSNEEKDTDFSNWCGWHNDHGSLTGLLPALYVNERGEIIDCPDPKAGLYIKSRTGKLVHAKLPENSLAFQVGETMQIHTGGWLQATPHAVRGCNVGNVTRETFAVFMEPEYHSSMNLPDGRTVEDTQCIEAEKWLPGSVQTLRSRWKPGMNFGEFSDATFSAFH